MNKTHMIDWRGGQMEFVTETKFDYLCEPPWYVLKLTKPKVWKTPWYYWVDYLGVPQIFLTKRMANETARALRNQYKCQVEIKLLRISK